MLKTKWGSLLSRFRTPQEQRLAIGLLCCLTLFVGFRLVKASQSLWSLQYARLDQLKLQIRSLENEIESERELTMIRLRQQAESLPADSTVAGTRYYSWLHQLATKHGWQDIKIDSTAPVVDQQLGERLTISLQGRAAIESLGALIDEFQSYELLHSVTRLQVNDIAANGRDGRVSLSIETLSLPEAPSDMLLEVASEHLDRDDGLAAMLSQRNPFRRYDPPKPVVTTPAVAAPIIDHLSKVKFVGVVQKNGVPEAWLFDVLNNQELLLSEGKLVSIGDFKGQLKSIQPDAITIVNQDQTITMQLGQDLRAALQEGSRL